MRTRQSRHRWSRYDRAVERLRSQRRRRTELPLSNSELARLLRHHVNPREFRRALIEVRRIPIGREHARKEDIHIYDVVPGARVVVKRGKREWFDRTRREADVHERLTRLQGSMDAPRYVAPLLARFTSRHTDPPYCAIVTRFMPHGSLSDAIREGRVHVTAARLKRWIATALQTLHWLHFSACMVHTDAKTDNWLLQGKNKDELLLFDFDECWARSDFIDDENFPILARMDLAKFLFTLEWDLSETDHENLVRHVRNCSKRWFGDAHDASPEAAFDRERARLIGTLDEMELASESIDSDDDCSDEDASQFSSGNEASSSPPPSSSFSAASSTSKHDQSSDDDSADSSIPELNEVLHLPMRHGQMALV